MGPFAGDVHDNGNDVDTDACLSSCINAKCGDMAVQAGVEECDDGNAVDTDMCLATCKTAKCGDSVVQAGVEDCDDGNMVDTDMCLATCKTAKCGDGKVQAGVEDCDDGNMVDNDACSNTCKSAQKIIFVTSTMYTGNLGGLAGADAKCQARAAAGMLPGTYLAWLSDNTGTPASRMTKSATPYVRPDGTKIANNWTDLTDGGLIASVDQTELKGVTPVGNTNCAGGGFKTVWTNTTPAGAQSNAASSCTNWSSEAGGSAWGKADEVAGAWTQWCSGGTCSWQSPIYCVQQ